MKKIEKLCVGGCGQHSCGEGIVVCGDCNTCEKSNATRWVVLARTSNTGKRLFVCTWCGRISQTPDKICSVHGCREPCLVIVPQNCPRCGAKAKQMTVLNEYYYECSSRPGACLQGPVANTPGEACSIWNCIRWEEVL